jgi:CMP-N-acetylneuraminic acid synthetase
MTAKSTPPVVALVPMRHTSERVPEKNYREIAGKPLYYHIMETLKACSLVSKIVVDTDSSIIKRGLQDDFPDILVIDRPDHLTGSTVPMNDVLAHDLGMIDADFFLQTHSTNPLLRSETVSAAIELFFENYPTFDSLFSVTRLQTRLWDEDGHPVNHDPSILVRTQDLTPLFEENSCLYIFERGTFMRTKNRLGARPYMLEIGSEEAWDIDEEIDFFIVESLIRRTT